MSLIFPTIRRSPTNLSQVGNRCFLRFRTRNDLTGPNKGKTEFLVEQNGVAEREQTRVPVVGGERFL